MSEHLVEIDIAAFVAGVGEDLRGRRKALADGGIIHVSRVEFVVDYDGQFDTEGLPFLRRQGLGNEYPLALAVSE